MAPSAQKNPHSVIGKKSSKKQSSFPQRPTATPAKQWNHQIHQSFSVFDSFAISLIQTTFGWYWFVRLCSAVGCDDNVVHWKRIKKNWKLYLFSLSLHLHLSVTCTKRRRNHPSAQPKTQYKNKNKNKKKWWNIKKSLCRSNEAYTIANCGDGNP